MDTYSPEDAAGDLQLEVAEQRPVHELRTPGAWRWLAPLGLCVTFAGALAISIFGRPEPASVEGVDALPGWSAPHHYEPLVDRAPAPPAATAGSAAAALVPSMAIPEPDPSTLPANVEPPRAAPAQEHVTLAAAAPASTKPASARATASPASVAVAPPDPSSEDDLPIVEPDDPDEAPEDQAVDDDADDDAPTSDPYSDPQALAFDEVDPGAPAEPALPGA